MKKIKNRILPQDDSQEAQVLNHLRAGNRISNASAVSGYNIYRLSAVIEKASQQELVYCYNRAQRRVR